MANVLIATLGESPSVVTGMFHLLKAEKKQAIGEIDKVVVLHPLGDMIQLGYYLIKDALKDTCELEASILPFEDANGEDESYIFLRILFQLLVIHQQLEDKVYLSLTGGRKNMSALTALAAPFFPCVKKLYHILDRDEYTNRYNFKSVEELYELSDFARKRALVPDLERLTLIEIPFEPQQRVSNEFIQDLLTLNDERLGKLWEEDTIKAEAIQFYRPLVEPKAAELILELWVTAFVRDEYLQICQTDAKRARELAICLKQMRFTELLKAHTYGAFPGEFSGMHVFFHCYKRYITKERLFYHTEPGDISNFPKSKVRQVIVSGLAVEHANGYEPKIEELLNRSLDPTPLFPTENLFPAESILVVPMGTSPMIATQLYTLLKHQGRAIRELRLLYPERSQIVRNSVELARKAFRDEGVVSRLTPIAGLVDIDSLKACITYQEKLAETIHDLKLQYPDCQIDLALSGGRKGMAALAMFVAQRAKLRYVYHTLINDDKLNQQVERETTVEALHGVNVDRRVRNDRLFLRAYEGEGPYTKFVLFKVPVIPTGER